MKLILGMLGGALLGAGAALLFAPQSGNATRSMLRDKAAGCTNDLQDFVESKSTHLRNKMQGMKHKAAEIVENAPDIQTMADDLKDKGQELLERSHALIDHGMDAVEKAKSAMDTMHEDAQPTMA